MSATKGTKRTATLRIADFSTADGADEAIDVLVKTNSLHE
ncbi:hypothetical protein J3R03_004439 [Actinoplanes couchii]|nr:hypothetical protein [Actinoplanes couchii]